MKQVIEFITGVMEEYSDSIENSLVVFGECMGEISEYIIKGVKHLLVGFAIVISYLFLAVTIPIWYFPYRFFKNHKRKSNITQDYAESLKSVKNPVYFKPSDCKHCYGASAGVMGIHYSCDCKESKMYNDYPLVMCPQDCRHYERESEK